MDFFDRQDAARRKTTLLVVYFVLAVVLMILALYAVIVFGLGFATPQAEADPAVPATGWWQPEVLAGVAGVMLLIIAAGSLYKVTQLRRGGKAVAEMLGGRRIHPNTTDINERRLLNVVEEMAL